MNSTKRILAVLDGQIPDRPVFAPNIWQWYEYQKLHNLLPEELSSCDSQLDVLKLLGVDVFSRNLITDVRTDWFGGHSRTIYNNVAVEDVQDGDIRTITYRTPAGSISEAFRFQEEGFFIVGPRLLKIPPLFTDPPEMGKRCVILGKPIRVALVVFPGFLEVSFIKVQAADVLENVVTPGIELQDELSLRNGLVELISVRIQPGQEIAARNIIGT